MYIVIELQTGEGGVGTLVSIHASRNEAENKYHGILAAAAVSQVPCHAAVILTPEGNVVRGEHYEHRAEEEQNAGAPGMEQAEGRGEHDTDVDLTQYWAKNEFVAITTEEIDEIIAS